MVKPEHSGKRKARQAIKTYPLKKGFVHELEIAPLKESVGRAREMVTLPHRADFYHILWVQSGRAVHLLDFKTIIMNPNSLLFIRKNRVLMYDKSGNYDGKVIRFTDGFFIRNEEDSRYLRECPLFSTFNADPVISLTRKDAAFPRLIELLEDELALPSDAHQHAVLQNLIHNFMMLSERKIEPVAGWVGPRDPDKDLAQKFMEGVEAGFRRERRVSAYAEQLGTPEKRLQAATRAAFGKHPKLLIDERVNMEANRLLLFGGATVKPAFLDLKRRFRDLAHAFDKPSVRIIG